MNRFYIHFCSDTSLCPVSPLPRSQECVVVRTTNKNVEECFFSPEKKWRFHSFSILHLLSFFGKGCWMLLQQQHQENSCTCPRIIITSHHTVVVLVVTEKRQKQHCYKISSRYLSITYYSHFFRPTKCLSRCFLCVVGIYMGTGASKTCASVSLIRAQTRENNNKNSASAHELFFSLSCHFFACLHACMHAD